MIRNCIGGFQSMHWTHNLDTGGSVRTKSTEDMQKTLKLTGKNDFALGLKIPLWNLKF